jgi:hypothetical protein
MESPRLVLLERQLCEVQAVASETEPPIRKTLLKTARLTLDPSNVMLVAPVEGAFAIERLLAEARRNEKRL